MGVFDIMTLPDWQIDRYANKGMIDPYNRDQLQPASYDVRLGSELIIFPAGWDHCDLGAITHVGRKVEMDASGWKLAYGDFVLGATRERVEIPNDMVARVEGKSSLGRLGLLVHVTAGFIDPGFRGNITLEIANIRPRSTILLRPDVAIAQLSFTHMPSPAVHPYSGHYQDASGVEGSRYGD